MPCKPKEKVDFIADIFETISGLTQTIIFVNTTKFAEVLFNLLKQKGYKPFIIFGKMSRDERDEYVEKFRTKQLNVVITTDLLARGFDMPTIKLVINFDVPINRSGQPEEESYLHRIGRAGRFGTKGVGITLFDRDSDEKAFWEIIEYFKM